jgi:hypothetical protein
MRIHFADTKSPPRSITRIGCFQCYGTDLDLVKGSRHQYGFSRVDRAVNPGHIDFLGPRFPAGRLPTVVCEIHWIESEADHNSFFCEGFSFPPALKFVRLVVPPSLRPVSIDEALPGIGGLVDDEIPGVSTPGFMISPLTRLSGNRDLIGL